MRRAIATAAAVFLLWGPSLAKGFEVFQDPSDSGTNPGSPLSAPTNGSPQVLNIYVQHGTVLSDPEDACSGTPTPGASGFCAWDLRIRATTSAVSMLSFVPESEPPAPDGVVWALTAGPGGELRANGGEPIAGQIGAHRVGALTVSGTGTGNIEVVAGDSKFVPETLTLETLPATVLAQFTGGTDSDGDDVPDASDNCPYAYNPGQEDSGGIATDPPDGIGDACQCGDVTGDGKVNSADATMITRKALGLSAPAFNVPCNCDVTDVSGDTCNSADATIITRKALGLSAPFGNHCGNYTGECTCDANGNCPP
jgi:hypothetical protein